MAQADQTGMEHWRRAVRWTGAGVFAMALIGGLVGGLTRGSLHFAGGGGGGGGGADAAAATTSQAPHHAATTSHPATTSATSAVSSKTAALGTAALLRLSDLPSGWTSGSSAASPTRVTPWSSKLAKCVGVPAQVAKAAPTKVNSPDFTSADQVDAVEDRVSVYPSATQAQAEYAALASSKTTGCMNSVASLALQKNMQKEAGSTTTVGVVSFAGLPAAAAALHMTGFTVSIPIARGGRVLTVTSTQVDFVSGALLHQVTFNGNGAAFPAPLEEQLLAAAQARH
ncbi:MAG TPA: hypothetical protein VIJ56_03230 [Acidimicrobiales bacterium]